MNESMLFFFLRMLIFMVTFGFQFQVHLARVVATMTTATTGDIGCLLTLYSVFYMPHFKPYTEPCDSNF